MRKIEEQMIGAIYTRNSVNLGNTSVTALKSDNPFEDCVIVTLFGNLIAVINFQDRKAVLNNCGYITTTTQSRLQAIVGSLAGGKISRKQGVMYYNGQAFTNNFEINF